MIQTKTKKILYLITKSNYGGAQKYVFDLVTNLTKDQFEVAVAAGGTGEKGAGVGLLAEKLSGQNISFYKIQAFTRDIFLTNELRSFFEIGKLILTYRPDVLHLNSSKAAGVGGFVGLVLGVKNIIYTVHGWPFNEDRPQVIKILIYFFSWLTCFLVHRVIVINPTDLAQGQKMLGVGHKMNLIYNGVGEINFPPKDEARQKISTLIGQNLSDTDLVLGTIAELHPNKNLNTLIRSISKDSSWKLVIIGHGQEKNNLQKLIQELGLENKVFLTGFITSASSYLKAFDAFALVSKKEGLPYVILEAGLASLPIIGSDIPGIRAIIDSDDKGLLVAPNDSLSITKALTNLTDKNFRETLGQKLKIKVQSEFSIDKMINNTIQLY